jgi:hypothetical protein
LGTSQTGISEIFHWQDCPLAVTVTVPVEGELTKFKGEGLLVALKKQALVFDS